MNYFANYLVGNLLHHMNTHYKCLEAEGLISQVWYDKLAIAILNIFGPLPPADETNIPNCKYCKDYLVVCIPVIFIFLTLAIARTRRNQVPLILMVLIIIVWSYITINPKKPTRARNSRR
jgi:hypothetical protein